MRGRSGPDACETVVVPFHLPNDHTTPGGQVGVQVDRYDRPHQLELRLVESQAAPHIGWKTHHREIASAPLPAGEASAVLTVPADLPPSYRGQSIGWGYEVAITAEAVGIDAADLVVEPPTAPTSSNGRALEESPSRRRSWVEAGTRTDGGTNTATVVGSLGLGILLVVLGITGPSWFGFGLGAILVAIGCWFGRDLASRIRHSLNDIELIVDEPVARPGDPVRVRVGQHRRTGLEVGLLAVELSLVPHRQTIVGETGLERWTPAGSDESHELATHTDDPVSYQGERVALVWFVALRDSSLPDRARRLTERRTPITVGHWKPSGGGGPSLQGPATGSG